MTLGCWHRERPYERTRTNIRAVVYDHKVNGLASVYSPLPGNCMAPPPAPAPIRSLSHPGK